MCVWIARLVCNLLRSVDSIILRRRTDGADALAGLGPHLFRGLFVADIVNAHGKDLEIHGLRHGSGKANAAVEEQQGTGTNDEIFFVLALGNEQGHTIRIDH